MTRENTESHLQNFDMKGKTGSNSGSANEYVKKFPLLLKCRTKALMAACILVLSLSGLSARGVRVMESSKEPDETKKEIERILFEIDRKAFKDVEETEGFLYLMTNKWYSPYDYDIYIGRISEKNPQTIVRIEGIPGDARLFEYIFQMNGLDKNKPAIESGSSITGKSYIISQGLNFIAPWGSVLYTGYKSPRSSRSHMKKKFLTYLLLDIAIIYAGGTNWFQSGYNVEKYRSNIAAGLFLMRVIGSVDQANFVRGHNRLLELKYSIPLTD